MRVELRSVEDCPNLAVVRDGLFAALTGLGLPLEVLERVGDFPSPTVLVDGADVTGRDLADGVASCRLDLPTVADIEATLRRATRMTDGAGAL